MKWAARAAGFKVAQVRLAVIDGGLNYSGHGRQAEPIRPEDVEAEAARRMRAGRVNEWRVRAFVTGVAAPAEVKYLELQINFAAQALCKLSPIPADFADDFYWPTCWND